MSSKHLIPLNTPTNAPNPTQDSRGFVLGFFLILMGIIVGILSFGFLAAGELYEFEETFALTPKAPEVDVVVCLAGGRGRIAAAAELWFKYYRARADFHSKSGTPPKVPFLYLSGVGPKSEWGILHKSLREEVRSKLTDEFVILEKESGNTVENALYLLDEARPRRWNQFLLVTSSYHMRRSQYVFEKVLGHSRSGLGGVKIYTRALYQDPFTKFKWKTDINAVYVTLFEYLKWIYFKAFWLPSHDFLKR